MAVCRSDVLCDSSLQDFVELSACYATRLQQFCALFVLIFYYLFSGILNHTPSTPATRKSIIANCDVFIVAVRRSVGCASLTNTWLQFNDAITRRISEPAVDAVQCS